MMSSEKYKFFTGFCKEQKFAYTGSCPMLVTKLIVAHSYWFCYWLANINSFKSIDHDQPTQ